MAKKPAEIPQHEQVILEPELEEALKNATDAEMCDIAGEAQTLWPEAAVCSGSRSATPSTHSAFDAKLIGNGAWRLGSNWAPFKGPRDANFI